MHFGLKNVGATRGEKVVSENRQPPQPTASTVGVYEKIAANRQKVFISFFFLAFFCWCPTAYADRRSYKNN
jgi:hypothetical protein